MPTWVKTTIMELHAGIGGHTYRSFGRAVGANIDDFVDDFDDRFTDQQWADFFAWERHCHVLHNHIDPNAVLRRLLVSERHPDGYLAMIVQIPPRHRANFLGGIADGISVDRLRE